MFGEIKLNVTLREKGEWTPQPQTGVVVIDSRVTETLLIYNSVCDSTVNSQEASLWVLIAKIYHGTFTTADCVP